MHGAEDQGLEPVRVADVDGVVLEDRDDRDVHYEQASSVEYGRSGCQHEIRCGVALVGCHLPNR